MRKTVLCSALLLGLGGWAQAGIAAEQPAVAAKAEERSVWLVEFIEPPLAAYTGRGDAIHAKLAGLAATSPEVTGEHRLNVHSPASKAFRAALGDIRNERLAKASTALGRPLEPEVVFDVLLNGMALSLTAREAKALAAMEGVRSVEPEFVHVPLSDAGPTWIGANTVWNMAPADGGNRGAGQVIGIIDTGINAGHRSFVGNGVQNPRSGFLGLCASNPAAGCTSKLIGIYDKTTGTDDAEANDGLDLNGHGTHVAATAAGDAYQVSFSTGSTTLSGVAPQANLISYKACEEEASCRGAWTLAALQQAVSDEVDVINYSIGGTAYSPWATGNHAMRAMLNARKAGIVVVAAAGNDGPLPGSLSSPSNAPWVISVGNVSHDRASVTRLTLSGGEGPLPGGGSLAGVSQNSPATGTFPIVHGGDYGSPLCATGSNVDAMPPSTSTSPWNGTPLSGKIVVCDRGIYARVIKGLNVKNAGGAGMVLVNQAADGQDVVADEHELPATHLGYAEGEALKQWLARGTGHSARLSASQTSRLASFGDVLAASSGRGPTVGDWLKPNVTAPGRNILAAYKDGSGNSSTFAYMSGTSMASPHVAGAVALVRAAKPNWRPDRVESALQGTATFGVRLPDGQTPAGVLDQGAGTINVANAIKAPLYFPISDADFEAANPTTARDLNQGSLVDGDCFLSCEFTRTVRSNAAGTWKVSSTLPGAVVNVTPAEFTLPINSTQQLDFKITPQADATHGRWLSGSVTLSSTKAGVPDIVIPMAIRPSAGNLPEVIEVPGSGSTLGESGWVDLPFDGLVAMPDARFTTSDLVVPMTANPTVPVDPTPNDRYDGLSAQHEGSRFFRVNATESGRFRFRTEVSSTTSRDIDLFVGMAASASSLPSKDSELCAAYEVNGNESRAVCDLELDVNAGDRFWVMIQNYTASSAGKDVVSVASALIPLSASDATTLVASGPGRTALNEPFSVRLGWNDPGFANGHTRWGHLILGGSDTNPGNVGKVLVKLRRPASGHHSPTLLLPGKTRTMRLAKGQTHDRLYIDVPRNARSLEIKSTGTGDIKLHLAHLVSGELGAPLPPGSGSLAEISVAPPRDHAIATSEGAGADHSLTISGAELSPGRWYITPENTGDSTARFHLTARIRYDSAPQLPGFGNWYNPKLSGSGIQLSPAADGRVWSVAWYTYLQDGTPVWYLGTGAAPSGNRGDFTFDVNRFAWNGTRAVATPVGEGMLSLSHADSMVFSWNLDGESGSMPISLLEAGGCEGVQGEQLIDGNWYDPARSGFGYDINSYPGLETMLAYLYDRKGQARWLQAVRERSASLGGTASLPLLQLQGSCPLCSYSNTTGHEVGALSRRYNTPTSGELEIDVQFRAPVPGSWSQDTPIQMLTDPRSCH